MRNFQSDFDYFNNLMYILGGFCFYIYLFYMLIFSGFPLISEVIFYPSFSSFLDLLTIVGSDED